MSRPKYDLVAVRKDGEEQTFTRAYDDKEVTSKFRKVGAVWERDGKLSVSFEAPITQEDIDDCWFNCFAQKNKDQKSGGKKPAAKKQPPKKPVKPQEEDPFEDNGDDL